MKQLADVPQEVNASIQRWPRWRPGLLEKFVCLWFDQKMSAPVTVIRHRIHAVRLCSTLDGHFYSSICVSHFPPYYSISNAILNKGFGKKKLWPNALLGANQCKSLTGPHVFSKKFRTVEGRHSHYAASRTPHRQLSSVR